MTPPAPDRRGLLLVVLVALLAFAPALGGAFLYDDVRFVVENDRIADPADAPRFFTDPTCQDPRRPPDIYRPLRTLVFSLERAAFGLDPAPWHGVQIVLHAMAAALVFLLLRRLGVGAAGAACGGAFFAVHPAQVEAVAWVSSLADVLAALLTLVAVHAWLSVRGFGAAWAIALGAGLLASLAKESAAVFPGFLVIVDLARPGGGPAFLRARLGLHVLPFLAAAAYALLVARLLAGYHDGSVSHLPGGWGGSPWTHFGVAGRAAAVQALTAAFPFRPSTEWYFTELRGGAAVLGAACLAGLAAVAAATVAALLRGRGALRAAAGGVAFALLGGLLTSHLLLSVGIPRTDRFLYLSLAGCAIPAGLLAERAFAASPRAAAAAALAALLALGAITRTRIADFRDEDRFWERATAGLPGPRPEARVLHARHLAGNVRLTEGMLAAARGEEAAAALLAEAREIHAGVAADAGAFHERWFPVFGGRVDEGAEARAWIQLSLARLRSGDAGGAREAAARGRALDPGDARGLHAEALALRATGRLAAAGWRMEESLRRPAAGLATAEAAELLNEVAALRLSRGLDAAAVRALRASATVVPDPRRNPAAAEVAAIEARVAERRAALRAAAEARPRDFAAVAGHVLYEGRGAGPGAGRAAWTRFLAGAPEAPALRVLWAAATMESDDTEEGWIAAGRHHAETVERFPGDPGAHLGAARAREALGDAAGAALRRRHVLSLPDLPAEARAEAEEGLRAAEGDRPAKPGDPGGPR